jgi:drug/metabolite transporter (DMT)-like permease
MVNNLKFIGKTLLFGFILWVSVFVVSLGLFNIKQTDPIFFETLITITLTVFTTLYGYIFFKKEKPLFKKSLVVGIIWLLINIAIDLPMFSFGPMKRPFINYMMDISFTYLVIPIILSIFSYKNK